MKIIVTIAILGLSLPCIAQRPVNPMQPQMVTETVAPANENTVLTKKFEDNKGKLQYPANGAITSHFGKQHHPTAKGVEVENAGVDFTTAANAPVRSVFEGKVSSVFMTGTTQVVVIQHGAYFTVYTGLASIGVKIGQQVISGQELGLVANDVEKKKPSFNFQVWRTKGEGAAKLNPEEWLKG